MLFLIVWNVPDRIGQTSAVNDPTQAASRAVMVGHGAGANRPSSDPNMTPIKGGNGRQKAGGSAEKSAAAGMSEMLNQRNDFQKKEMEWRERQHKEIMVAGQEKAMEKRKREEEAVVREEKRMSREGEEREKERQHRMEVLRQKQAHELQMQKIQADLQTQMQAQQMQLMLALAQQARLGQPTSGSDAASALPSQSDSVQRQPSSTPGAAPLASQNPAT